LVANRFAATPSEDAGATAGRRYSPPTVSPTTAKLVFTVVASGVFGLLIGSFLNVVVYRVPRHMSVVRPRSHCPQCGTELTAADNVPVASWLALRGHCRHCGAPISPRYPAVELSTAVIFVSIAWALGPVWALPPLLLVAAAVVAATAIDLDSQVVPASVVGATALGAAGLGVATIASGGVHRIAWAGLGAASAGVLSATALHLLAARRRPPVGDLLTGTANARRWLTIGCIAWCAGWLWAPGIAIVAGGILLGLALAMGSRLGRAPGVLFAVVAVAGYVAAIVGAIKGGP